MIMHHKQKSIWINRWQKNAIQNEKNGWKKRANWQRYKGENKKKRIRKKPEEEQNRTLNHPGR
jgi:hypothetical protein